MHQLTEDRLRGHFGQLSKQKLAHTAQSAHLAACSHRQTTHKAAEKDITNVRSKIPRPACPNRCSYFFNAISPNVLPLRTTRASLGKKNPKKSEKNKNQKEPHIYFILGFYYDLVEKHHPPGDIKSDRMSLPVLSHRRTTDQGLLSNLIG